MLLKTQFVVLLYYLIYSLFRIFVTNLTNSLINGCHLEKQVAGAVMVKYKAGKT